MEKKLIYATILLAFLVLVMGCSIDSGNGHRTTNSVDSENSLLLNAPIRSIDDFGDENYDVVIIEEDGWHIQLNYRGSRGGGLRYDGHLTYAYYGEYYSGDASAYYYDNTLLVIANDVGGGRDYNISYSFEFNDDTSVEMNGLYRYLEPLWCGRDFDATLVQGAIGSHAPSGTVAYMPSPDRTDEHPKQARAESMDR